MKAFNFLSIIVCLLILGCQKNNEIGPDPKVDFNKEAVKLMDLVRPKLYGTWVMDKVNIKPVSTAKGELGIQKDTTLLNLAVLDINRIDYDSNVLRAAQNDVTGIMTFRSKQYPIGFQIMATGDWVYHKSTPQLFSLFEYRFPVGSHLTTADEAYLSNITLMDETYSIAISEDGKSMVWSGLNRAVKSIHFIKR